MVDTKQVTISKTIISEFSDALEMYKRRCRRWEERHNGNCCVVERVRDKYVMPRVREFLAAVVVYNNMLSGGPHGPSGSN